ncbi:phospholipase D-like domain-containing protein [Streptomyces peucetius]
MRNGNEIFPAMLSALEDARHTVGLMTFVSWRRGIARQFTAVFAPKARAGVPVRMLLDSFGSRLLEKDLSRRHG